MAMCLAQLIGKDSVVRHLKENTRCSRDAGKRTGEKAHHQANIDECAKERHSPNHREYVERRLATSQSQRRPCEGLTFRHKNIE